MTGALLCAIERIEIAERTLCGALSLVVGPGEVWVVTGPAGSGKSLLVSILAADNEVATIHGSVRYYPEDLDIAIVPRFFTADDPHFQPQGFREFLHSHFSDSSQLTIMDDPTAGLFSDMRDELDAMVSSRQEPIIVATCDVDFMNKHATGIIYVHGDERDPDVYIGSYQGFAREKNQPYTSVGVEAVQPAGAGTNFFVDRADLALPRSTETSTVQGAPHPMDVVDQVEDSALPFTPENLGEVQPDMDASEPTGPMDFHSIWMTVWERFCAADVAPVPIEFSASDMAQLGLNIDGDRLEFPFGAVTVLRGYDDATKILLMREVSWEYSRLEDVHCMYQQANSTPAQVVQAALGTHYREFEASDLWEPLWQASQLEGLHHECLDNLSPGQRAIVRAMGGCLAAREALVLQDPTCQADARTREHIGDFITRFPHTTVIASEDPALHVASQPEAFMHMVSLDDDIILIEL